MLSQATRAWIATIFGITGAALLATNTSVSGWGFVAFLVSSIIIVDYCSRTGQWHMMTLNAVYVVINMVGVFRWLM